MSSVWIERHRSGRPLDANFVGSIKDLCGSAATPSLPGGIAGGPCEDRAPAVMARSIDPGAEAQVRSSRMSLFAADHGMHIAKADVLDYLKWDATLATCGAVVGFEGWRHVTRIRHQAH